MWAILFFNALAEQYGAERPCGLAVIYNTTPGKNQIPDAACPGVSHCASLLPTACPANQIRALQSQKENAMANPIAVR